MFEANVRRCTDVPDATAGVSVVPVGSALPLGQGKDAPSSVAPIDGYAQPPPKPTFAEDRLWPTSELPLGQGSPAAAAASLSLCAFRMRIGPGHDRSHQARHGVAETRIVHERRPIVPE